jgi:hypothetical protein
MLAHETVVYRLLSQPANHLLTDGDYLQGRNQSGLRWAIIA